MKSPRGSPKSDMVGGVEGLNPLATDTMGTLLSDFHIKKKNAPFFFCCLRFRRYANQKKKPKKIIPELPSRARVWKGGGQATYLKGRK